MTGSRCRWQPFNSTASDASTQLVLTEQGVFLDGHDTPAQREEGTRSLLASLATTLEGDAP